MKVLKLLGWIVLLENRISLGDAVTIKSKCSASKSYFAPTQEITVTIDQYTEMLRKLFNETSNVW